MKWFKKLLRILFLVFLIILASFGAGLMPMRARYQDKETRVEIAEKKDDESEESKDQE